MERTFKCTREQFNQTALHRPDVSKATLCRFLANCCGFLFSYRGQIDHLRGEVDGQHGENVELEEENRTLKEEASWLKSSTIHAQQSVISLQAQLLDCKERKFDSVQSAVCNVVAESVQSEMKSYSAALTENQKSTPPAIKTLMKAIKQVVQEEDRSKNILVFGLPEGVGEDTNAAIDKVFECVGEKPRHESVRI